MNEENISSLGVLHFVKSAAESLRETVNMPDKLNIIVKPLTDTVGGFAIDRRKKILPRVV